MSRQSSPLGRAVVEPSAIVFDPPLVAHRGASARAPENTLAAFREAARCGCRWVEFDVKLSRDGVPFVIHDDRLERTTDGRGRVRDLDADALARLDAGSWFDPRFSGERIPTLAETLALLLELDLSANIEIKPCEGREEETAEVVAAEVHRLWPADRPLPLFSSFSRTALETARRVAPEIPRGLLREAPGADWAAEMQALGCLTLHLDHKQLAPGHLRRLAQAGVPVLLYTVNDPARARALLEAGAAAVFTDVPDLVLEALAAGQ